MSTYVVAIRREVRADTMTAEEWVRQVPGVHVKGAGNPSRVVIEASPQAVFEIESRFGDKVILEPEVRHDRLSVPARKSPKAAGQAGHENGEGTPVSEPARLTDDR